MAQRVGHEVAIVIEDNGTEFDMERLRKISKMLQSDEFDGSMGVGIWNVHSRLKLKYGKNYGVSIYPSSTKTQVLVHIPYNVCEKKRVLTIYKLIIIDDEAYTCEGLKRMLDWKSYSIEIAGVANDGADGLKLVQKLDPDIIITDINMPMLSGLDMAETLRSGGYDGKIIILTGYRYFEYAKRAIDSHTSHYLLKPIDIPKLKTAVIEVVRELDEHKRTGKHMKSRRTAK